MKTAVQWLEEKLKESLGEDFDPVRGYFVMAKEMEKEQKVEDWQLGYDACEFHNDYDELQKVPMKNPYRNKK